jgi:hypothetical protein
MTLPSQVDHAHETSDALRADLVDARRECAMLAELLHAALDQLHAAHVTGGRLRDRLRETTVELRRLRPIVKWVEDERREQGVAA